MCATRAGRGLLACSVRTLTEVRVRRGCACLAPWAPGVRRSALPSPMRSAVRAAGWRSPQPQAPVGADAQGGLGAAATPVSVAPHLLTHPSESPSRAPVPLSCLSALHWHWEIAGALLLGICIRGVDGPALVRGRREGVVALHL